MDLPRQSGLPPYTHSSLFGKKIIKRKENRRKYITGSRCKALGHSISTFAASWGHGQNSPYLPQTSLCIPHNMGYGLHNALIMQRAQRSPFAPTHLFHHCSPLVLLPELGGRSAHNLPILIGSAQVCTSSFPLPGGSFGPKGLVFASSEAKPSFESGHESLVKRGGVVGFGKNRETRSFFTNRLRFQIKHMGNFMNEPSLSLLQRR